jgi:hypothetical protein
MANPSDLTRLVPGFDFLQNLMKGAGAGIPGMSQWIAPTINPEELEKRIAELKTVQFWLENNARLLATTIQALEVQRMTLNTLQTMNLRWPTCAMRSGSTCPKQPRQRQRLTPATPRKRRKRRRTTSRHRRPNRRRRARTRPLAKPPPAAARRRPSIRCSGGAH